MSLPRASDIAANTGIAQSYIQPKAPKTDKKAEEAKAKTLKGEDEEGEGGAQGGAKGAGKSGGAGAAQAFDQGDKQKVKRKRVKLSELTSKKTGETKAKAETAPQQEAKDARVNKTTPEEIGRKVALAKLNEQSKLAETRFRYEQKMQQSNADPNNALSPQARQKRMLASLINYQHNNYMQHTGDKAGEIYNRPATRQILQALQGLKAGSGQATASNDKSSSTTLASNTSPAAFKAKTEHASKMLEVFMREDTPPPPGYEPTEMVA